jgi:peptidyl-prolyl cis-trans isomerase D
MALLGTIRNRFGWVMMGLIFLGMVSFLFMDISPGNQAASGSSTTVGYVNGEKVSNELVQQYSREYQGNQLLQEEIHKYVWERIVSEKLLSQKTVEAGIVVTPDEMGDMFLSSDPSLLSPTVVRRLGDQKTRQVNTEQVKDAIKMFHSTSELVKRSNGDKKQLEQLREQQANWLRLEQSVQMERSQNKYFAAVEKGIYTPTWMVEMERKTQDASYTFDYVRIPYTDIIKTADVSDKELTDYIAAHPKQYKREATASIEYLVFQIDPTSKDSMEYRTQMEKNATAFSGKKSMADDSLFINLNDGDFPADFFEKDQMSEPKAIVDSLFDSEEGTVFGPYIHNGKYRVLKKIVEKKLPDSVNSRHILIRAENPTDRQAGRILLDSLQKVLETDPTASFDSLALKFSQDGSRTTGGDLGWKAKDGSFVPEFEEYMFFTGEKDSLRLLYTQFGVHLIQIKGYKYENDKLGVRIATIDVDIIPSRKTTEDKQREVIEFITNNRSLADMKASAKKIGLIVNPASSLEQGGYEITGIGKNTTSADIIRWAHDLETAVGTVTNRPYAVENEELNYREKFVITALSARTKKGLASIEDPQVKADVDRIVRNQKKTELVKAKLSTLTSLDAIAGAFGDGLIKETATSVQYANGNLGVVGAEPKVVALAAATAVGQTSGAVGGKEGVYVLTMTSKADAPPIDNVKSARDKVTRRISQVVSGGVYEGMKESSQIEDNRAQQY